MPAKTTSSRRSKRGDEGAPAPMWRSRSAGEWRAGRLRPRGGGKLAGAAVAVAGAGLLFVLTTLLSLISLWVCLSRAVDEAVFLVGPAVVFVLQISAGAGVVAEEVHSRLTNLLA
jgi:hypothetical protein